MQSSGLDEKRESLDYRTDRPEEDIFQGGSHEGEGVAAVAQNRNNRIMATGSAKLMRYILFAVFV
jgi:hypothetical protein